MPTLREMIQLEQEQSAPTGVRQRPPLRELLAQEKPRLSLREMLAQEKPRPSLREMLAQETSPPVLDFSPPAVASAPPSVASVLPPEPVQAEVTPPWASVVPPPVASASPPAPVPVSPTPSLKDLLAKENAKKQYQVAQETIRGMYPQNLVQNPEFERELQKATMKHEAQTLQNKEYEKIAARLPVKVNKQALIHLLTARGPLAGDVKQQITQFVDLKMLPELREDFVQKFNRVKLDEAMGLRSVMGDLPTQQKDGKSLSSLVTGEEDGLSSVSAGDWIRYRQTHPDDLLEDDVKLNHYLNKVSKQYGFSKADLSAELVRDYANRWQRHSSTPQQIIDVLGAPYRALGGIASSAQEHARYAAQMLAPGKPTMDKPRPLSESVYDSLFMTPGRTKVMADVFQEAAKQTLGRELTTGESLVNTVAGLGAELLSGGPVLRALRMGRGGSQALGVTQQIDKAFRQAGIKGVSKQYADEIIKTIKIADEQPNFSTKVAHVRLGMRDLAKKLNVDNAVVEKIDQAFIKSIGKRGESFGKTGVQLRARVSDKTAREIQVGQVKLESKYDEKLFRLEEQKKAFTELLKQKPDKKTYQDIRNLGKDINKKQEELAAIAKKVSATPEEMASIATRDIPLGGERVGVHRLTTGLGQVRYGAGTSPETAEALRPSLAFSSAVGEDIAKTSADIRRLIYDSEKIGMGGGRETVAAALATEKRMAIMHDMQENLGLYKQSTGALAEELGKTTDSRKIQAIKRELDVLDADYDRALSRAGLSRAEAEAGFIPKNDLQKQAYDAYKESVSLMRDTEKQLGLSTGEVGSYAMRRETPEIIAARKRLISSGYAKVGKEKSAAKSMNVGREEHLSTSLAGTKTREFIEPLAENHAVRGVAHVMSVSRRMAEKNIIAGAREITDDLALSRGFRDKQKLIEAREFLEPLEKQGLGVYVTKSGKDAGRAYILDLGTSRMLDRMYKPKEYNKIIDGYRKVMDWWKGEVTVLRPGFANRNLFGGNLTALWQGDVDIIKSLSLGAQMVKRHSPKGRELVSGFFDRAAAESSVKKVGMYTIDEAYQLGLKHGVPGGGWYGAEIAKPSALSVSSLKDVAQTVLPLNNKFIVNRMVRRINQSLEDMTRWAMFMGKLDKGYTAKEAAQEVAKRVFNYNESAPLAKAGKMAVPFYTFITKNLGIQVMDLLNKPDKFLAFMRTYQGVQDIDPVTGEALHEIPGWSKDADPFFVPGARGEGSSRLMAVGSGLFPILSSMGILKTGYKLYDDKKIGDAVMSVTKEMWPPLKLALMAAQPTDANKSPWAQDAVARSVWYDTPSYMVKLMNWAKTEAPQAYKILIKKIKPSGNYALGDFSKYKWPSEVAEVFATFLPNVGTINRFFRSADDSQYREITAYLTGMRLFDLTKEKVTKYKAENAQTKANQLKEILKSYPPGTLLPPKGARGGLSGL